MPCLVRCSVLFILLTFGCHCWALKYNGVNVCAYFTPTITVTFVTTNTSEIFSGEDYFGNEYSASASDSTSTVQYVEVWNIQYVCCEGWLPNGYECTIPYCNETCLNGGTCIAPNNCSCSSGYTGEQCETDINECLGSNLCQQQCVNVPGTYKCNCSAGYVLEANGFSCVAQSESVCNTPANNCEQLCYESNGGFSCACKQDFTLNSDNRTCNKIVYDPCNPTRCEQNCTTVGGKPTCFCQPGYMLISDGYTCQPLCLQGCENGGWCSSPGVCSCPPNWEGDSCENALCGNCENGNCVTPNHCACNSGWTGPQCNQDINECLDNNGQCQQICINVPGSYMCECNNGYVPSPTNQWSCTENINQVSYVTGAIVGIIAVFLFVLFLMFTGWLIYKWKVKKLKKPDNTKALQIENQYYANEESKKA
ncbi:neurogenic locus protein delta-like [Erpetoichthys calabaricus]|uniref:neurogenic locus protein delta-like n=1 Tax=Erpetoichthys calabaricus TaxID=27687 RepID=UPI00109F947C|nr:neurogenic locus protein delta-like [Erpetoichthys calabaricus]